MGKNAIYGFLKLIRFEVSLFGCIGLFISGVLAEDLVGFQVEYLVAFFIVFISASGAFALNDYYDYEVDKTNNRRDRPLVTGLISRRTALITAISSLLIVISLSLLLKLAAMILVMISVPLFYLYSIYLKKKLYIKNLLIAFSYLITIILGSLISDSYLEPLIIYFAIMGFIVGLANEIMFDIADVKGDYGLGIKTISTKYGIKRAAHISTILYIVIIVLDLLPFFVKIDQRLYLDYLFLILILIPVISYIILTISLLKKQTSKNILKLRNLVFIIMQIGTISYLIGVLI
ncbi:MAG: UbiA family prenyltransferase [Candidatus Lokiarchaeota archaeon]|nr:UbiA family prenyltransferase [Candidatus Lokiarchaeota archaeon]